MMFLDVLLEGLFEMDLLCVKSEGVGHESGAGGSK